MTVVLTIVVLTTWWFFVRHQNQKTSKEIRRQSEIKETLENKSEVMFNRKMTLQDQDVDSGLYLNSGSVSEPWCMEGTFVYVSEAENYVN
jgi:hypothetical protein